MNKRDKLVYQKIARKDLSFGCEITIIELWAPILQEYWYDDGNFWDEWYIVWYSDDSLISMSWDWECIDFDTDYIKDILSWKEELPDYIKGISIIGHPILLSDVLNYTENLINEEWLVYDFRTITEILSEWNNKFPTYEEQSESCKELIYNLIK